MLFNIILFAMVAAIAYFHYAQGLFTSALSAVIAIIAAMLAIGYHETVASYIITYLKMPEEADAVALILIFVAAYGIGRILFDKMVPGNVQFPLLMDKIGSAVLGVIAGVFATGILALAAQSMPFAPSIGGFSRQDISSEPRAVTLAGGGPNGRAIDSTVSEELLGEGLGDSNHAQHLWLHQDDLVLGMARQLSDTGAAFSFGTPLDTVHPDYTLEMFGQRLGAPGGIRKLALSSDKLPGLHVSGAFALAKAPPHIDGESREVRGESLLPDVPADMTLVVVRANFLPGAGLTDATDPFLRLSPAGVRLKTGSSNYFPIGTMVGGMLLLQNRADDPLVIDLKASETVDFVFAVSPDELNVDGQGADKKTSFKQGAFLEVMRYALADLSGMTLSADSPQTPVDLAKDSDTLGGILRQPAVIEEAGKKLAIASTAAQDASGKPQPAKPQDNLRGKDSDFNVIDQAPGRGMGL